MVIFKYLHYRYFASVATCGDVATTCPPLHTGSWTGSSSVKSKIGEIDSISPILTLEDPGAFALTLFLKSGKSVV